MRWKQIRRIHATRTCLHKVAYPDRASAEKAKRDMTGSPSVSARSRARLEVYVCPCGSHYHVGKRLSKAA